MSVLGNYTATLLFERVLVLRHALDQRVFRCQALNKVNCFLDIYSNLPRKDFTIEEEEDEEEEEEEEEEEQKI